MPYPKCKIYSDRSHYIAIPHTERPYKPRKKPKEETVLPTKESLQEKQEGYDEEEQTYQEEVLTDDKETFMENSVIGTGITRKELFENLYREGQNLKKKALRCMLVNGLKPYFRNDQETKEYVDRNLRRKHRNLIARRIRMSRKANLQEFNYFVTVTYLYGQF